MKKPSMIGWLIAVFFCFSVYAFQLPSWVRVPLKLPGASDDNASILIPSHIIKADSSSASTQLIARDSTGIYWVMNWNIMTGDGLHDSHRKRMYEDAIKNLTNGTTRTLYSRAEILIAAYRGIEFVLKEDASGGQTSFIYGRCVISEHTGYLLYFAPADKGGHKGLGGKTFFDSFTLRH
ncbi:hypothetical protein FNT36_05775 [Hymenobacter setariae]|uniref:Uncharacterized protein n=1 Tax=Hymenobacter setariae TaxID=2594794 RepID=A0A558C474_9BACT|nr:hypothetical protein [Hymenobacter setariae]TVT43593.1 hypothetical protein FNT36_05775 [Hymenobacter setariae]